MTHKTNTAPTRKGVRDCLTPEALAEIEPAPTPATEPIQRVDRPLTEVERRTAYEDATRDFQHHYAAEIAAGMSDAEIATAMERCLGIYGGSCGPGKLYIEYRGAGLCIWASTVIKAAMKGRPLFSGAATVAMAREVYGIVNPQERQMRLF